MQNGLVIVLFEFVVPGLLCALLCTWLSRLVLRVLRVPDEFMGEQKRERFMTLVFYLSPALVFPFMIGPVLLLGTYAVVISSHFHDNGPTHPFAMPRLPCIPRFALSELLVMVFSIATFPLLCSGGRPEGWVGLAMLIYAVLLFPLCFASAFLRLDGNKVPLGKARFAFLFLYPYCLTAWGVMFTAGYCELCGPRVLYELFIPQLECDSNFLKGCAGLQLAALLVIILTYRVARQAKREAEAASAANPAPAAQVELTPPTVGVTMNP